jgi:hypothetical protein
MRRTLNPVEGIWSVLKRGVLAYLAVASFSHLTQAFGQARRRSSQASSTAASPEQA